MLWFWILGWLLSILAVLGNGAVIYLICTRRALHTTANWFILSLGVTDFCVGISLFPPLFACDTLAWCNKNITVPMRWFFLHSSVVNLCTMTLDRYIAIVKPLRYVTIMRSKRVLLMIVLAWGTPTVCFLIPFTILFSENNATALKSFFVFVLIFLKICPIAALFLATARIILITRKVSRQTCVQVAQVNFNNLSFRIVPRRAPKSQIRSSARVIVVVVCLFFLCYTIDIYFLLCDSFQLCTFATNLKLVKRLLLITNSAANPLTYAFLKQDIKREIKRFFRCARKLR